MYRFAFKNLWKKKSRSLLALIGLSIAITGVIGLISISGGIRASVTDVLSKIEGVVVLEDGAIDDVFSTIDLERADDIRKMSGVKAVAPIITGTAKNVEGGDKGLEFNIMAGMVAYMGFDPAENLKVKKGSIYNPLPIKGRSLQPGDRHVALIGKTIADQYKKSVGSTIEFNDIKFRVIGIFSMDSMLMDSIIAIPLEVAQEISGKEAGTVSTLYVELRNPKDAEKVATKINFRFDDLDAKSGSGYGEDIGGIIASLDIFFLVISSVAVIVGAIGILNTMLMSVLERTQEFGILKAVGWTSDDVMKLVVFESFFLGIIGGAIGCLLGYVAAQGLASFIPFKPYASPELLFSSFMLAIVLGVAGGIYPAWRASKLDPIEAIRFE